MPTSLAHSVAGVAAARATGLRYAHSGWVDVPLVAAVANLPDLDLLPGLLVGEPFRYHHGASHTLLMAVAVGTLVFIGATLLRKPRRRALRLGLLTLAVYASHVLADTIGYGAEGGIRLLRPFSDAVVRLRIPPPEPIVRWFASVDPEVSGILTAVTSAKWLGAMALEALLFAPLLLLALAVRARAGRRSRAG